MLPAPAAPTPASASLSQRLSQRIEEASLNAWPALHQVLHDGWVLRFCHGFTRRANSVSVLHAGTTPLDERIAFCERLYSGANLPAIFRIASNCPEPDLAARLTARGYRAADPTHVLYVATQHYAEALVPRALARDTWLDAYAALSDSPTQTQRLHSLLLQGIRLDALFAVLEADGAADGTIAACGLAVAQADLVGIFDVVTAVGRRRRGLGTQLVRGLLAWGASQGATTGYLQVVQTNGAALKVYEALGFAHLHDYHYLCPN